MLGWRQHERICAPLLDCLHHLTGAAVAAYTKLGALQVQLLAVDGHGQDALRVQMAGLEREVAVSLESSRSCTPPNPRLDFS